jgi:hypothetical protein
MTKRNKSRRKKNQKPASKKLQPSCEITLPKYFLALEILNAFAFLGASLTFGAFASFWSLNAVLEANIWISCVIGAMVGAPVGTLFLFMGFVGYRLMEKDRENSLMYSLYYDFPTALVFGGGLGAASGAIIITSMIDISYQAILLESLWVKFLFGTLAGGSAGSLAIYIFRLFYGALGSEGYIPNLAWLAVLIYESLSILLGGILGAIAGAISSQF